jgi:hypothetical protein
LVRLYRNPMLGVDRASLLPNVGRNATGVGHGRFLDSRGRIQGNYTAGAGAVNETCGEKPHSAAGFGPYHGGIRQFPH